ncbi:MAG TPA: hypothetical protein P5239_10285 [Victivallales bacterium]|nr:hypothetical protein [Victivallales bacterium]
MKDNHIKSEKFIAFAVLLQSFLVILQQVLISVFYMQPEATTTYRVILTAVPLSVAIIITLYRKWQTFLLVYGITILVLLFNIIIFPQNEIFLKTYSLRFLLPVVIPSALCLIYLSNIDIVESVLYKISWSTFFLVLFYVISYFSGNFVITDYNMSFSYGLLLPMLSLYSKKNLYSLLASLLLFLIVLGIGSRGAAIVFMMYVVYDIFQSNKKFIIPVVIAIGVFFLSLNTLAQWFESIGIFSRTLNLIINDDIGYMSGRDILYDKMTAIFWENPIKGIGLFGDRHYLDGAYTHNLILELYLNWGIIGATFIILFFVWKFVVTFIRSDKKNRNILVKYLLASVAPLMVSGSYLIEYDLGIFIGVLFLIGRENKKKRFVLQQISF